MWKDLDVKEKIKYENRAHEMNIENLKAMM